MLSKYTLRIFQCFIALSLLITSNTNASSWIVTPGVIVPVALPGEINSEIFYLNNNIQIPINHLGATSSIYFKTLSYYSGQPSEGPWICHDEQTLKGNGGKIDLSAQNLSSTVYQLQAISVIGETQCDLAKFESGKLIQSTPYLSEPFMISDGLDLTGSTLTQPNIDDYRMLANWPTFSAINYKLIIIKDNVEHYIDIPSNSSIGNDGYQIIDQFDTSTQLFTPHTGFGEYSIAISYCSLDLCTKPISSNMANLIVKPTFNITASVTTIDNNSGMRIAFETDARTPKFRFYDYFIPASNPDNPVYDVFPIEMPDDHSLVTLTNDGRTKSYQRDISITEAGEYEIQIQPCTITYSCQSGQKIGIVTIAHSDTTPYGKLNKFFPGNGSIGGVVNDIDGIPTKIRLYHNGNYIVGTETSVIPSNNSGFFVIMDFEDIMYQSGIDVTQPFNLELRALDHPSLTNYHPVTTKYFTNFTNQPPIAVDDVVFGSSTGSTTINLTANDFDLDGDSIETLSFIKDENAVIRFVDESRATIEFTPDPTNSNSIHTFKYNLRDEHLLLSEYAQVSVIYSNMMANDDEAELTENLVSLQSNSKAIKSSTYSASIDVLANDINRLGLDVDIIIIRQPPIGNVTVDSSNMVHFSANQAVNNVCFSYAMLATNGDRSNVAKGCFKTPAISVEDVTVYTELNTPKNIFLIEENDIYSNNVEIEVAPHGTAKGQPEVINNNGVEYVRFTPTTDEIGTGYFQYRLKSNNNFSRYATAYVIIGHSDPENQMTIEANEIANRLIEVSFSDTNAQSYQLQSYTSIESTNTSTLAENAWQAVSSNSANQTSYTFSNVSYGYHYYRVKSCNSTCTDWFQTNIYIEPTAQPNTPTSINTSLPTQASNTSSSVGMTKADYRIDESGAFTYTIPLSTPNGIADNTPHIALSYSSSQGNGIMGAGWSLAGGSAIERCRQTYELDNQYKNITFTDEDRFCLDGQRLIEVGSDEEGTIYKTVIASPMRIKAIDISGNGPKYFKVEKADGSINYYGSTSSSYIRRNSDETVLTWLLAKTIDSSSKANNHNSSNIEYFYRTFGIGYPNLTDESRMETVLDRIEYSGNTIDFKHSFGREDKAFAYTGGFSVGQHARLNEITISNHSNNIIASYHLNYIKQGIARNNQTQLHSIQQCGERIGNNQAPCLQPTYFDWDNKAQPIASTLSSTLTATQIVTALPIELHNNGILDVVYLDVNDHEYTLRFARGNRFGQLNMESFIIEPEHDKPIDAYSYMPPPQIQPIDINGDGISEIAIRTKNNGEDNWKLWKLNSTGTAFELDTDFSISAYYLVFNDFNGDGLTDIMYRGKMNGTTDTYANHIYFNQNGSFATNNGAEVISFPDLHTATELSEIESTFYKQDEEQPVQHMAYDTYLEKYDILQAFEEAKKVNKSYDLTYEEHGQYLGDKLADFNGDGLADILASNVSVTTINIGSCKEITSVFTTKAYTAHFDANDSLYFSPLAELDNTFTTSVGTGPNADCKFWNSTNKGGSVYLNDINSDGLSDVVYQNARTGNWEYIYATGNGFTSPLPLYTKNELNDVHFVDLDADGDSELIYSEESGSEDAAYWYKHENINGQFSSSKSLGINTYNPKEEQALWLDMTGNGVQDFVKFNHEDQRVYVKYINSDDGKSRIKKVTDGYGTSIEIDYKPLTDSSVYSRSTGSQSISNFGNGSPVFDLIGPNYVVSEVWTDAPGYNEYGEEYLTDRKISVQYKYHGLKAQTGGRGMLGYQRIISYDPQSGVTTQTEYSQQYPYIGMPISSKQCFNTGLNTCSSSDLLSSSSNVFNNDDNANQPKTINSGLIVAAYIYKNTIDAYTLNSDGSTSLINRTTTTTNKSETVDAYLQIDDIVVKTHETANENYFYTKKTTSNSYNDTVDIGTWWVNRLSSAQVIHERGGASTVTRNAAFEYSTTTGLLSAEYLEPNSVDPLLFAKTAYEYDSFGNVIEKTQCSIHHESNDGCFYDSTITTSNAYYRRALTEYDSEGRYVTSTGNDLFNHTTETPQSLTAIASRDSFGSTTQYSTINGVVTASIYDHFGALYAERNNIGGFSKVTRSLKTNQSTSWPTIDEPYHFVVQTINSKQPIAYQYFDRMGREVATVKQGFAQNSWIHQYNRYDALGRIVKQSLPFHYGQTIHWSTTSYDVLNRAIEVTTANGSTTQNSYSNLTTTITTDGVSADYPTITQTKSQVSNILGETASVTDSSGTIYYYYNALGRLKRIKGVDDAQTTMTYNSYGHRTALADPDKGKWQYTHNALGEQITQEDNRGNSTTYYYDNAGRKYRTITGTPSGVEQVDFIYTEHQLTSEIVAGSPFKRCYTYDSYGRSDSTITILDGSDCFSQNATNITAVKYTQSVTYDGYGRIENSYDGTGKGIKNEYQNGYLHRQVDSTTTSKVYSQILAMNAAGQVTSMIDANGKTITRAFDPITGLIESIYTDGGKIQQIDYKFDGVGNLRKRHNISSGINQDYVYDTLNRLTTITGYDNQNVTYDTNGNILTKSDVQNGSTYLYNNTSTAVTGSHAVTSIGNLSYEYDANGNQTKMKTGNITNRTVTYSHFNKPLEIDAQSNGKSTFSYGPARKRYKRVDVRYSETTTTYYVGNLEIVELPTGVIETKRYVGNALEVTRSNNANSTHYIYKDHLGSLDTITNSQGKIESKSYFDPFGDKHQVNYSQLSALSKTNALTSLSNLRTITNRGFTGHEYIYDAKLIHMNGRVYDPIIGRMIQPDPLVQAPDNSQNLNRYSYVLNNPLRYTDPSGYAVKPMPKWVAVLLTVIIGIATNGDEMSMSLAWGIFWTSMVTTNLNFRASAINVFSAWAFSKVGDNFSTYGTDKIIAHGVVGGVTSKLHGGKFGHGFASAGLTQTFAPQIDKIGMQTYSGRALRVVAAATLGGSVSKVNGGKFGNGAVTAAFSRLFNDEKHKKSTGHNITEDELKLLKEGNYKLFWRSRYHLNKDPVARVAIIGWKIENLQDESSIETISAAYTWNRMEQYIENNELNVDMQEVAKKVAQKHAEYIQEDPNHLLSPDQVAEYHHDAFKSFGIPKGIFGGTWGIGDTHLDAGTYDGLWCKGCDSN